MPKRENYLTWTEYFITIAQVCALRSKDPNTQIGVVIVRIRKLLQPVITACREAVMTMTIHEKIIREIGSKLNILMWFMLRLMP